MATPNFIRRDRHRTFLIAGITVVLTLTIVITGAIFGHESMLTAVIGDGLKEASPTPEERYPQAPRMPKELTNMPTVSAVTGLGSDTIRYYELRTGKAFQIDLKTRTTTILSAKKLDGFIRTIWAPNRDDVVSAFTQSTGTVFRSYHYATGLTSSLDSLVSSVTFSPDGRHIAYVTSDADHSAIFISDIDGAQPHKIIDTRIADAELSWPLADTLVLVSRHAGGPGRDMTVIGADGSLAPLLSNISNLEYAWSRDGSKLLYSYFDQSGGVRLWYMDVSQHTPVSLGLATSASKCAWHNDNTEITCGVPSNTALAHDVSAADSATLDDIITLHILTGEQTKQYSIQKGVYIGVIDPVISSSGSFFVFTNLFDQKLYSLPL
jgi:dipeptidyl aminopeptidase/acylaminoacyl peptidase